MRFVRLSLYVAILVLLLASTVPAIAEEGRHTGRATSPVVTQPAWLRYVNQLRKLAGLPGVSANAAWSEGDRLHSRYMVKNDEITHNEDSSKPWYTEKGALAGANGNVMVSSTTAATNRDAIDMWMTGPFHGVGIIDPQLRKAGFAIPGYEAKKNNWRAAILNLKGVLDKYGIPFPAIPEVGITGEEISDVDMEDIIPVF